MPVFMARFYSSASWVNAVKYLQDKTASDCPFRLADWSTATLVLLVNIHCSVGTEVLWLTNERCWSRFRRRNSDFCDFHLRLCSVPPPPPPRPPQALSEISFACSVERNTISVISWFWFSFLTSNMALWRPFGVEKVILLLLHLCLILQLLLHLLLLQHFPVPL